MKLIGHGSGELEKNLHFKNNSGPLDVETMSRDVPLALHDSWLRERASGETTLDYDLWLEGHLWSGVPVEQQYRQGLATFALRHRGLYRIKDPLRGARSFRCMVERQFPFVSFVGAQGSNLPWLTVPGLFTVDELVSLRQVGESNKESPEETGPYESVRDGQSSALLPIG